MTSENSALTFSAMEKERTKLVYLLLPKYGNIYYWTNNCQSQQLTSEKRNMDIINNHIWTTDLKIAVTSVLNYLILVGIVELLFWKQWKH